MENINLEGTTLAHVPYGSKVTLRVRGRVHLSGVPDLVIEDNDIRFNQAEPAWSLFPYLPDVLQVLFCFVSFCLLAAFFCLALRWSVYSGKNQKEANEGQICPKVFAET